MLWTHLNSDKHAVKTLKNFKMGPYPKANDSNTIDIMQTVNSFLLWKYFFISFHIYRIFSKIHKLVERFKNVKQYEQITSSSADHQIRHCLFCDKKKDDKNFYDRRSRSTIKFLVSIVIKVKSWIAYICVIHILYVNVDYILTKMYIIWSLFHCWAALSIFSCEEAALEVQKKVCKRVCLSESKTELNLWIEGCTGDGHYKWDECNKDRQYKWKECIRDRH